MVLSDYGGRKKSEREHFYDYYYLFDSLEVASCAKRAGVMFTVKD